VNFGVLSGWVLTIIAANALTSSENGVLLFLATVLAVFFCVDLLKIAAAKKLKNKLTLRVIIKTKKWVSILIVFFGVFMLFQGVLPSRVTKNIERIDVQFNPVE
jgi:drug/metabolite transporter (DMT)-like permease